MIGLEISEGFQVLGRDWFFTFLPFAFVSPV